VGKGKKKEEEEEKREERVSLPSSTQKLIFVPYVLLRVDNMDALHVDPNSHDILGLLLKERDLSVRLDARRHDSREERAAIVRPLCVLKRNEKKCVCV